jgi:hypothetical protein
MAAPGQHPGSRAQDIDDVPPRATLASSPEAMIQAPPRRMLAWQQAPRLTARLQSLLSVIDIEGYGGEQHEALDDLLVVDTDP